MDSSPHRRTVTAVVVCFGCAVFRRSINNQLSLICCFNNSKRLFHSLASTNLAGIKKPVIRARVFEIQGAWTRRVSANILDLAVTGEIRVENNVDKIIVTSFLFRFRLRSGEEIKGQEFFQSAVLTGVSGLVVFFGCC